MRGRQRSPWGPACRHDLHKDSGVCQENQGAGSEGSRRDELTADAAGKASRPVGGKHGSGPVGVAAF